MNIKLLFESVGVLIITGVIIMFAIQLLTVPDKSTSFKSVPVYVVTEAQLEEIKRGGGAWVQVDSFQYGDDVESYKKVVHCRIVNGHVQCMIDEVRE